MGKYDIEKNIARNLKLLKFETDATRRQLLLELLLAEEAKRKEAGLNSRTSSDLNGRTQ
jgi:hypothetical protein